MAGIDKDFSYSYEMEASESSLQGIGPYDILKPLKSKLSKNDDIKKSRLEDGKLHFRYKVNQNLRFSNTLEIKKHSSSLLVKGTLHRELTGWGSCLICATLGLIGFMIARSLEKEKGEELINRLDSTLREIEVELKDKGKLTEKESTTNSSSQTAVAKLKERFAEGEIDEEEYRQKLEILQDDGKNIDVDLGEEASEESGEDSEKCPSCGKSLQEEDRNFCTNCGTEL